MDLLSVISLPFFSIQVNWPLLGGNWTNPVWRFDYPWSNSRQPAGCSVSFIVGELQQNDAGGRHILHHWIGRALSV
jgi:hypothetical protein